MICDDVVYIDGVAGVPICRRRRRQKSRLF